jgi:2-polyprenyl-3-methyl-5-hydroxy-6-metoxy-1,4-benzoquinol methylase
MVKVSTYLNRDEGILNIAKGRKVLHLGCIGHTDYSLEDRVRLAPQTLHRKLVDVSNTVGVDLNQEAVEEYRRANCFENILVGDVQRLDDLKLSEKFEVIVAADIIEHVSCPGAMLNGLKRFCNADTKIIITTPHAFGFPNYIRYAAGRFVEGEEHVLTFNIWNLVNIMERHGFLIEVINTCYHPQAERHGSLFTLAKQVFKIFPKFGGTLFVVANLKP